MTEKDEEYRTGELVVLPNSVELAAMMNHATTIQASWRGRQTRIRHFHGRKDKNQQIDPNVMKLKSVDGYNVNAFGVAIDDKGELNETLIQKYTRCTFENVNKIQFCIDGAIHLPCNCTTTRVTTKLVNVNMKQVGELSVQEFSSLDSDFKNPYFNLTITWPVDLKDMPSLTIVCRVDTLERPSMKPRVVGYASLKLCRDINNDNQPTLHESGQYYFNISYNEMRGGDHIVLNSGEYLIPLVHGVVPLQREFNEELMETLIPIPGSQLRVRLFDPTKDKGIKKIDPKIKSNKLLCKSVASIVLSSYLGNLSKLPTLNNARDTFTQLLKVKNLSDINQNSLKSLNEWISLRFPLPTDMREVINPRRIMKYNPTYGAMSSLDMIYNLPTIVNDNSEWVKNNLIKKNLGCASCFKSVFKYLPGSDSTNSSLNNNSDPYSEIFDVSCIWSMNQPEACPTYQDDFCTSANLQLSSNACILIVVNAVDVYTPPLEKKTFEELVSITTTVAQPLNYNESDRKRSFKLGSIISKNNLNLKKQSKSLPKGVADINIITDDDSTWWGLLPLFSKSTFQNPSDSPFFNTDINSYFVDEGTHQVPLFKGKPPDSIIFSSSPFLSLLDLLNKQWDKELPAIHNPNSTSDSMKPIKLTIELEKQLKSTKTSKRQTMNMSETFIDKLKSSLTNKFFNAFGKAVEPAPIEIPKTKDTIVLSEGASAFIRVVDSSCKGFANKHMNDDGSRIIPRYETMNKIFRYSRGIKDVVTNPNEMLENENNFNELVKLFRYEALRFENNRLLRESFPVGINHAELLDIVNDQYEEIMDS